MKGYSVLLLFVLLTSGCVDQSAVRNFANIGSEVTASDPVISGWQGNFTVAHQVALSPEMSKAAPGLAAQLEQAAADADKYAPIAEQAAQTLSLYLHALSLLADDKLPDVNSQAQSIDKSLAALKVDSATPRGLAAKGASGSILRLLQIPIDQWRQYKLRQLIVEANPYVQLITEFLATTADAIDTADKVVGETLTKYYEVSALNSHDSGVRALLRYTLSQEDASVAVSRQRAATAAAAFTAIGRDHAVLAKNADDLSNEAVRTTLANDAPVLEAALKIFTSK
jgi:hypothetical protein